MSDSYPENLHNYSVNLQSSEAEECPRVQTGKNVLNFFLSYFFGSFPHSLPPSLPPSPSLFILS